MAITRVEIKDFLVFKGEFNVDFCPGVNVLIGANGTGKTTLLKTMYAACERTENDDALKFLGQFLSTRYLTEILNGLCIVKMTKGYNDCTVGFSADKGKYPVTSSVHESNVHGNTVFQAVYIPERDLLSSSKGIPESYEYGKAEYTRCDVDIVKKARVLPNCPEQPLYRKICDLIGGEPQNDGQSFFMKRQGVAEPISFSLEASGYRRFGLLATLIRNEQITSDSILFWDEPENSLNPELVPELVSILLELANSGVQIFIATHDYNLTRYFDVRKNRKIPVNFYNLIKDVEGHVQCRMESSYMKLSDNHLEFANGALFKAVVESVAEVTDNG